MKQLLLTACCSFLMIWGQSQQLTGKLTDAATGAPIAAATVALPHGNATVTDESGSFRFDKLKPGTYTVRITHVGYHPAEASLSPGTRVYSLQLEKWDLFMQPVEVRAVRAGQRAPFTKTDISGKELEQRNLGQDLPFILDQTPSAVVNSDAGNGVGYTAIRIRGTDATRINVTLNGIPYNDAESQGTYFVDLPDFTSSVNNIQIQRGVGTSSNGAGAFGATINLNTNEVKTDAYGEINNTIGSFNTWKHTVKLGTGLLHDHFTFDARLSKISSDGFIDRATSDLRSLFASAAYLGKNTSVRFNLITGKEKTYQAWNGIPEGKLRNDPNALETHYENNVGALYFTPQDSINLFNSAPRRYNYFTYPNQTDNYQQDHYQLFINHRFNPNLAVNTAFFLSRGRGYYEEYKVDQAYADYGLEGPVNGGDTLQYTDLVRQLWLDNYFYGQIFSLQYRNTADQFTLGGGWNRYDGKHYGDITWSQMGGIPKDDQYYYNKAYKTDLSAYAKYQRQLLEGLDAFLDLQYRRVLYDIGGFDDNPGLHIHNVYNFFNPKVGISYSANHYEVYASYSQSNKEPNRDDFEAGQDQQPTPEHLHDFELGLGKTGRNASWGATLYYMLYRDQLVLTGKINDVGSYTRTNIPDSYRMGIELQGKTRITSWMEAGGNLAFSRNRIRDFVEYYDDYDNGTQKTIDHGATDIALSPGIIGNASVTFMPVRELAITLPGKYVGRQYLDNTSNDQRKLDPYYVQDARVSYALKDFLFREIDFIFQVNNVFDKKYEPNGYTYSYQYGGSLITENFYYPMAGTNVLLAVNVKL